MAETAPRGLVCYYLAHNRDGSVRQRLYRPVRGPWTAALRNRVPPHERGVALADDPDVEPVRAAPKPRRGIVQAEIAAQQGRLL